MLPKFRPAALGPDGQARPSIRPLRPSPPPPPPSPPRRNPSGFGPRGAAAAADSGHDDADLDAATAKGNGQPSTIDVDDRAPETVPRELPDLHEERTNALPFEDETQARPVDQPLLDKLRDGSGPAQRPADLGIDYEALPSLEVRRPYDTYEAAFAERDPVTQLHVQHESARMRRAERAPQRDDAPSDEPAYRAEPSYQEPSYQEPIYQEPSYQEPSEALAPQNDQGWGRREESGPRERPLPDDYAAPPADWSGEPPQEGEPAREEKAAKHPAFVMGVQPIRPPTPDAWGTPQVHNTPVPAPMHAMHSSRPPAYAQQAHYGQQAQHPHYEQAQPYAPPQHAMTPPPVGSYPPPPYAGQPMHAGASGQMPSAAASMMNRAQPVGTQLAAPSPYAKVGRMAWFVAGAAFGITFAFFATGFFGGGKAHSEFPAAPPLPPVATAPEATAPAAPPVAPVVAAPVVAAPVVAAPVAAPVVAAPVALAAAPTALVAPPVAAPVAAAPPVAAPPVAAPAAPPAAAPAPVAVAPAPAARPAPRAARPRPPPRRPSAPVSQAPKNLGGGGPGADEEPRSPAPAPPMGGDLGDLLGAGLRP